MTNDDKPEWWPKNPYPENIFPMDLRAYEKIVPDSQTRTALSGSLGREFWRIASDLIWCRVKEYLEESKQWPVQKLNFSIRTENCLLSAGVTTVDQLIMYTPSKLLQLRSFGKTSLREVKFKLADMNLSLANDNRKS